MSRFGILQKIYFSFKTIFFFYPGNFLLQCSLISLKLNNFRAKSPTTWPRRSFSWRTRQFGNRNLTKSSTSSRLNRSSSHTYQKSLTKRRRSFRRSSNTKLFFLPIQTYQLPTLRLQSIPTIRQTLLLVIQQRQQQHQRRHRRRRARMTMQFSRFLSRFDFQSTEIIISHRRPFTASGHPAGSSSSQTGNFWIILRWV